MLQNENVRKRDLLNSFAYSLWIKARSAQVSCILCMSVVFPSCLWLLHFFDFLTLLLLFFLLPSFATFRAPCIYLHSTQLNELFEMRAWKHQQHTFVLVVRCNSHKKRQRRRLCDRTPSTLVKSKRWHFLQTSSFCGSCCRGKQEQLWWKVKFTLFGWSHSDKTTNF